MHDKVLAIAVVGVRHHCVHDTGAVCAVKKGT
jgi:hypothetical protein